MWETRCTQQAFRPGSCRPLKIRRGFRIAHEEEMCRPPGKESSLKDLFGNSSEAHAHTNSKIWKRITVLVLESQRSIMDGDSVIIFNLLISTAVKWLIISTNHRQLFLINITCIKCYTDKSVTNNGTHGNSLTIIKSSYQTVLQSI